MRLTALSTNGVKSGSNILCYYIAGVPASGKSTIMKQLIAELLPTSTPFKAGKLRGVKDGRVYVLGIYDGGLFDGTDRLAMDVINDAIEFVRNREKEAEKAVIIAEGDRLFNKRFLDAVHARIIVIDANPIELARRHKERGDTQPAEFLKRTRTKVENIVKAYGLGRFMNNTPSDSERLVQYLTKTIKEFING